MQISLKKENTDGHTIQLSGEFDALGCKEIRSDLEDIVNNYQNQTLCLDLDKVSFIDSSGIGAIVFLFKRLTAVNSNLTLVNVHGQVRELITLLGVQDVISVTWGDEPTHDSPVNQTTSNSESLTGKSI